ncbi:MAG: HPr family phosphocarrier protein [Acutalibacteraceae bacterium]|nr:HPr family phosphocarrier protein [Acutalibacteraceae bacterium]
MYSTTIYIPDIATAKRFVDVAEKYPDVNMLIISDNLEIDPHSIMGVLSLDLNKKLTLQTNDTVTDEFKKDLTPFMLDSELN